VSFETAHHFSTQDAYRGTAMLIEYLAAQMNITSSKTNIFDTSTANANVVTTPDTRYSDQSSTRQHISHTFSFLELLFTRPVINSSPTTKHLVTLV